MISKELRKRLNSFDMLFGQRSIVSENLIHIDKVKKTQKLALDFPDFIEKTVETNWEIAIFTSLKAKWTNYYSGKPIVRYGKCILF